MQRVLNRLPTSGSLPRRRGAFAGFIVGAAVPLLLVGLFIVSLRGYANTEQPQQVYSNV